MLNDVSLDGNNFGENLVVVHETVNEKGEKFLVCASPNQRAEDKKQISPINGSARRNGKHCYFSGL